jgi:hypothetical protein
MPQKSHEELEDEYEQNLSLLSINKQAYNLPVSSSNVADRSYQQYIAQPNNFTNVSPASSANIIFNTGSLNVNGPNSTIQCSIGFDNVADRKLCWAFGNNLANGAQVQSSSSILNIVRESLIQARSGSMIQRNTYCNVLGAAVGPFEKGIQGQFLGAESGAASWVAGNATAFAGGSVNTYGAYVYPVYSCDQTVYFELPLSKVLTFFATNSPLCGIILSGAKLTINFESMLTAFVFYQCTTVGAKGSPPVGPFRLVDPIVGAAAVEVAPVFDALVASPALSYKVENLQLLLDTTQIFDSSQALIQASASSLQSSGLQFPFWSCYQTRTTLNTSSNTIDIMISCAKLKDVIVVFRSAAAINTGTQDSFARLPLVGPGNAVAPYADGLSVFLGAQNAVGQLGADGSVRLRLGSQLNTLTPIRSAGQLYRQTYNALTTVKMAMACDVDPIYSEGRDLAVGVSYSDYVYGSGATTIAFDMSRSPVVSVSGSSSNNSKALLLELVNLNATVANPIVVDVFVRYLACLNSSTENSVLDS